MSSADAILEGVLSSPIKLVAGKGDPDRGGCWMSALSMYAGESWSDHPDCVSPLIGHLGIAINDALPDDEARGRVIGPHLLEPVGTRADASTEIKRTFRLADAAIRQWAPAALRYANLPEKAKALESLAEVTDQKTAAAADAAAAAAADAAARAAAAADAAADAREQFIVDQVMPVFHELCQIGDKRPIEMACSTADMAKAVQAGP